MAADERSVKVTLEVKQTDSNKANTSSQTETSSSSSVASENDNDSSAKATAKFAVTQCIQVAASEVVSWAEYKWNQELTLTDDYVGQRNKTIAMTQINRTISTISTVGSMTAAGAAVGGPVGAAIGAVIGLATSVSSIVRSNIQGQEQQNIQLAQMNASLSFTRQRTGWSTTAASIGEDL